MSQTLSVVGLGSIVTVQPGQTITYSATVSGADPGPAFDGLLRFMRSRNSGASWEAIETPAEDVAVVGATVKNETKGDERYAFRVDKGADGTALAGSATCTITENEDVLQSIGPAGAQLQFTETSVKFNGTRLLFEGGPSVRQAEGVPVGAPSATELPLAVDSTPTTGGLYYWTGSAWAKIATIPGA